MLFARVKTPLQRSTRTSEISRFAGVYMFSTSEILNLNTAELGLSTKEM